METIGQRHIIAVFLLVSIFSLSSCNSGRLGGRDDAVWKNYDYLTPVPSNAPVVTSPGYRERIRPSARPARGETVQRGNASGRYDSEYDYSQPAETKSCIDDDTGIANCQ